MGAGEGEMEGVRVTLEVGVLLVDEEKDVLNGTLAVIEVFVVFRVVKVLCVAVLCFKVVEE